MEPALIWEWVIKSLVIIFAMLTGFAYLTFYERKALARIQSRIGPNRAGPGGWLQPVADGIKLIFKEELIPAEAEKVTFIIAPIITVLPALVITAVVPWGDTVTIFGREVSLTLANLDVGILYVMAIASIAVYGIMMAGWSSNNKYATLGGLRASAQMISYELALGMAFAAPVLLAGSLNLTEIVKQQSGLWYIVLQPVGFFIFLIAILAEVNRAPFDMPEAEQELTAGYHTEYSGMKFALFFMAEYIKMIAVSAFAATLFLGGYRGPFIEAYPWLGPLYLFLKVFVLLFVMIWVRATLPRFRYDRLMAFGWKVLFPTAMANVLLTAVVVVFKPQAGGWALFLPLLLVNGVVAALMLALLSAGLGGKRNVA